MPVIPSRDITHAQLLPAHVDERRGRRSVEVRGPRTAAMLRLIEPSVPERLVDRFTRLVDNLVRA